jgi:hypothetical protein
MRSLLERLETLTETSEERIRRVFTAELSRAKRHKITPDSGTKRLVLKLALEMNDNGDDLSDIAKAIRRGFGYKLPGE